MTEYRHVCADAIGCERCHAVWQKAHDTVPQDVQERLQHLEARVRICHNLLSQAWSLLDPSENRSFCDAIKAELGVGGKCEICDR